MGKKIVFSLFLVFLFLFNSCGSKKPKTEMVESRGTGWLIEKTNEEAIRQISQKETNDSIQYALIDLGKKVDLLNNSTNNAKTKNAQKILNLELEKAELIKRVSKLGNEIGIDAQKIQEIKNKIEKYNKEPSKKDFEVLVVDLEKLTVRNNIKMNTIFDITTRLKQIDEAISDLIVEECKLGRILTEEVRPFDYYFETSKCSINSDNPDFLIEFRSELEATVSDFLLQCPNMKIYLTITIEGYSDSQKFNSNSRQKNLILSQCRAEAIQKALGYYRNDQLVETTYNVIGLGEKLPYPNRIYRPNGTDDQSRRICKIKAVLKPLQNP